MIAPLQALEDKKKAREMLLEDKKKSREISVIFQTKAPSQAPREKVSKVTNKIGNPTGIPWVTSGDYPKDGQYLPTTS